MNEIDDIKIAERAGSDLRRAQDGHDLNNEIAGRDVGRQARFRPSEDAIGSEEKRKREATERILSELQRRMLDENYVRVYEAFDDFLRKHASATGSAIEQALQAQSLAHQHLGDLTERANSLPDGRKVFRSADGRVLDENGREISKADADSIVWLDGAPNYEEFLAAKDAAAAADQYLEELYQYENQLGEARDRLENDDDPMTIPEMEAEQDRLERDAPSTVRDGLKGPTLLPDADTSPIGAAKPSF